MKKLETHAQAVWAAKTLGQKKVAIISLIDQFDHKDKAQKLQEQSTSMSMNQLDKLAADLMLRDTDKVIKL
jgi:hypothetical protein